ncbi:MAG: hypothetical protein QT08_C0016G0019 [archaeon GW2011_AR17]|nr:MAG: hypothetical protein QT08_C0016G0019 [archaeon GW2011_AR17]MBS3154699.1 hypothetical protein [Candidatus Woesearchaeota archaeon]HIH14976.1 hypothetical protein [Nanoarchaeota archaeon]HIH58781.1 hypothetical protein [Nanoarchaeota archaeon]HII13512.1 hypothetical protein [Nanoarchaeota archaeon]
MKKITIPSNSFLAIMDRELKKLGFKAVYVWDVYFNTILRKKEAGILLYSLDGHQIPFDIKHKDFMGILGFVNGQEPGEGSIPLHSIIPHVHDTIALAYVIEGIYKGNFSKTTIVDGKMESKLEGFHLIHHYTLQEKDLEEKPYEINIYENSILSEE